MGSSGIILKKAAHKYWLKTLVLLAGPLMAGACWMGQRILLQSLNDQVFYFGFPDQKQTNKQNPPKQKQIKAKQECP